jgi:hypothetical protein
MSGLLSSSAIFAVAIAAGAITTSPALASDNPSNRSGWTLLPGVQSRFLPATEGATQLAQTETTEAPAAAEEAPAAAEGGAAGEAAAGEQAAEGEAALEDDEPPIQPQATDALIDMGEDLRALQEFAIRMDATREQLMDSGQKIQFGGTVIYRISRPDAFRMDILTDTGGHQIYYDGKTLTLYTPGKEYYGQAEAKPTIRETIEWMEDTYGVETPLADLFDWGTERAPFDELEFAFLVGNSRVDGVLTQHYAFRMEETDFEVWLETGDRRLPLKFVITDRTEESMPQFEATLKWSTLEKFDDYIFTYSPSADAMKIPLTPLDEWAKLAEQAEQQ